MTPEHELEQNLEQLRQRLQRQETRLPARDERLRGMGFFEAMVKSLPEAVAVLRDGAHVHCNEAWARLFGFTSPAELTGKAFENLLEPAEAEAITPHLRVDPEGPARAWAHETKGRAASGQILELQLTGRAFLQGGTAYVSLSARDLRIAKRAEEALKRNEWWWRHMFRMSLVGMAVLSPDGRFLAANDAICQLVGYSKEELVQKSLGDFAPEADLAVRREAFAKVLEGRSFERFEMDVIHRTGELVPVAIDACALFRPDGRPEQVLMMVQDLSEQKQAQDRLSATQDVARLLGAAVEQSPASIVITDRDGTIQYVNTRFVEVTGYTAEEAKGRNPRILKSGLQGPEVYTDMWTTLMAGKPWSGQLANRRKDGSVFWEKALISPILSEGEITHFLAVKEDITRSREMELSHRRLLSAMEFSDEAIGVCSLEGDLIQANPAFHGILGCPCPVCPNPDLAEGECRMKRFFREPGKEILEAVQAGSVDVGHSWKRRMAWVRNPGEKAQTLAVSASLVNAPDAGGQDLLIVCRDVTQDQELEKHLRHVEKMDALGTMVSGITHDFNNVLTAIQSAAELIGWQLPEDSPARSKLAVILQASGRARELNRQILTFARPSQDRTVPFDLSALTRECVHLLKNGLPKDMVVQLSITSSLWVTGDPGQLHQVLMNLCMNAVHAMEGKRGALTISLSESGKPGQAGIDQGALLAVRDNGCGMDEETLKRACEPFFSTRQAGKGTGLGLSMVHGIVQRHGGVLHFDSTVGAGTEVQVWLPTTQTPALSDEAKPMDLLRGQGHILLVDLEGVRVALTKEALQGLGYSVTAKADPIEALQAFREHPAIFDLVMLEYSEAALSAEEFVLRIRKLRKDLPVLLVSGSLATQTMTAEEIARGPFDAVLTKPFGISELGGSIQRLLEAKRSRQAVAEPAGSPLQGSGRVLIAEDSAVTLSMLKSWLTKAGYSVAAARDGQEAWELLQKEGVGSFAMVFSDVVMPRMDGIQLVERIRELDAEIPVVLLSSSEDMDAMKAAVHLQVSEFLSKPFDSSVLLACAGRLLSGAGTRVRSAQTAQAVRMAQKAMVALPEKDLPLYSVHQSLTDAGGDVFRCFRQPDGSIFFVLADVAGHSVISSYAVAAFLGMLTSFQSEVRGLPELALKLNRGIQQGPFAEVPVCVLMGSWTPATGRLHLLNAGLPHGIHSSLRSGCRRIEINGTPLGIFDEPIVEEKVLVLEEGDRLLFGSDGVFDVKDSKGKFFDESCTKAWCGTSAMEIAEAVSTMGSLAHSMAEGGLADDLLLVGFAQPATAAMGLRVKIPSEAEAIDLAVAKLENFLANPPRSIPLTHSRKFDILTAAREALTNALFHGNEGDPDKDIWLLARWQEHPPALHLTVLDEGKGFDLAALTAPTDALSERGRGIPFLRHCAGQVQMAGGELSLEFPWED